MNIRNRQTFRLAGFAVAALAVVAGGLGLAYHATSAESALAIVEGQVERSYKEVDHVDPEEFLRQYALPMGAVWGSTPKVSDRPAGPASGALDQVSPGGDARTAAVTLTAPLILDVREEHEFAVSHLPGAVRVSPDATLQELAMAIGELRGRDVVMYCSVGVRSSMLAARLGSALHAKGARRIMNLSGGIFRWHNESRPLLIGDTPTDAVHPFDKVWGKLIRRQDQVRYSAKP